MELREPVDGLAQQPGSAVLAVGALVGGQVVETKVGGDVDHRHARLRGALRRAPRPRRVDRRPQRRRIRPPARDPAAPARPERGSEGRGDRAERRRRSARLRRPAPGVGASRSERRSERARRSRTRPATSTRPHSRSDPPISAQRGLDRLTPLGDLRVGERAIGSAELEPQREALSPLTHLLAAIEVEDRRAAQQLAAARRRPPPGPSPPAPPRRRRSPDPRARPGTW